MTHNKIIRPIVISQTFSGSASSTPEKILAVAKHIRNRWNRRTRREAAINNL